MSLLLIALALFPVSVWYGGGKARAPMVETGARQKKEQWRKDVRAIKETGFRTFRCWVDWASGEPSEGKYDLETLDVLLDLAQEEDMKLVVQIYTDSAPDYLGRRYPESLYESISGQKMKPEAAPGYCRDHPAIRKAELAFIDAVARTVKGKPAFLGWDLWSEPHVINWADATWMPRAEYCYCPSSQARYRQWLKAKYGTLDALNKAWYRRFQSWDEVEPNRLSTILSYTDYIDWRTFIQDKLGEDLRDRFDTVKKVVPNAVATSHAASPSLFTSPLAGDGSPDDWIMRNVVDYYGTSLYPKHSYPIGRDPAMIGASLDFAKSSGYSNGRDGWWIGELQSGFGTVALNVSGTVTPSDVVTWMWSAVSRGAKALNVYAWYPMNTGYESGGYGLINLDGTITERAKAAGNVAKQIRANEDLFSNARPAAAEVAILNNPMVYFIGGRQRIASNYGPQSEVIGIERDSMLGVYQAMFPSNVPVDFVHVREMSAASLKQYKLLYVPYPLMLPEAAAPVLREYVANGGTLVTEARAGWTTEKGRASEIIPGMGLHELLGCRETAVQSIPQSKTEIVWDADTLLPRGTKMPARLYEETLEPLNANARVVARFADGRSAGVMSTYGKGKTLTLGSYVSPVATPQFVMALLDWAGVERPVTATEGVEVRLLDSGRERIAFAFNHSAKAVTSRIGLHSPRIEWSEELAPNGVSVTRITPDGRRAKITQ